MNDSNTTMTWFVIAFLFVWLAWPNSKASAEVFVLKSGKTITGEVIDDKDGLIKVKEKDRIVSFKKNLLETDPSAAAKRKIRQEGIMIIRGQASSSLTPYSPRESRMWVEIFITSWCPYCRKLEQFLKAEHIPYRRYDIEANPQAKRVYDQFGIPGVPVIRIGSKLISGFDQTAILNALK